MNQTNEERIQAIIEESKKLLCRPWEEIQAEIKKRQTLGKLPSLANVSPPPDIGIRTKKPEDLPPSKPHI